MPFQAQFRQLSCIASLAAPGNESGMKKINLEEQSWACDIFIAL